ncbi:PIN domain-containing protein [Frigoribacterium faeni]|uniref:PIN domain-containing protein n=1 Tax=Frigoribacterium faeni TaxID=145483 RepID=UPI00141BF607|nr:hypothetical protein [Frigoribacterium faeni]NIJ05213.1 hypothetical protein [Frigoribacterium faeni]
MAYTELVTPSRAALLSGLSTQAAMAASGQVVVKRVEEVETHLSSQIQARNNEAAAFPYKAQNLPRLIAEQATLALARWPSIADAVAAVVAASNPGSQLRTWSESDFTYFRGAYPDVVAFMGELAEEYGLSDVAASYYHQAVAAGASPGGYWRVREIQCQSDWTTEQQLAYLEPVNTHPWAHAAIAQLRATPMDGQDLLDSWNPESESERAQHMLVATRTYLSRGNWDSAEQAGRDLWRKTDLAAAGLLAIEAILGSHHDAEAYGGSSRLAEALDLALEVRNRCRELRLPSGQAVAKAMRIALTLGDSARAIRLGLPLPDGDAIDDEATSIPVSEELAYFAARSGETDKTLELLTRISSASRRNDILGLLEEAVGHESMAVMRWCLAADAETSPRQQAILLWRLALRGVRHKRLVAVAAISEDVAASLELTVQLVRNPSVAVPEARTTALSNRRTTLSLLEYFSRTGRHGDAEQLAIAAAQKFEDADLWQSAAEFALRDQRANDARRYAEEALACAPVGWGSDIQAHRVIINASGRLDDWDAASKAAKLLLKRLPDNPVVVWTLVEARYRAGDFPESLKAWEDAGRPRPIERNHALTWLDLRRQIGPRVGSISDAIEFVSPWPHDEQLRAALLITFITVEVGSDELSDVRGAFASYWEDFPEGGTLQRYEVDSSDVLNSINNALAARRGMAGGAPRPDGEEGMRSRQDQLDRFGSDSDLEKLVEALTIGSMPLGMLSSVQDRTYSEVLVLWGSAPRHSSRVDEYELQGVGDGVAGGVVVDLSSIFTLSVLHKGLAASVFGAFPSLAIPAAQYRDAIAGEFVVRTLSGLSLVPQGVEGGFVPLSVSDEDLARAKDRALQLSEWAKVMSRLPPTETRGLPELSGGGLADASWVAALDAAVVEKKALWADDAALRSLARSKGIGAFSTAAVMSFLLSQKLIEPDLGDVGYAQLQSAGYVGVPFTPRSFALALQLDKQEPAGTAQALRFATPTESHEINARMELLLGSVSEASHNAELLRRWIRLIGDWLIRLGGDSKASDNLTGLMSIALDSNWLNASTLPFVIQGIRDSDVEDLFADDSIIGAFLYKYRQESITATPEIAFSWLTALCSNIDDPLRLRIVSQILTGR